MAVRNFYVEANIDGRETTLGGGPAAKDGEMTVHIHQRKNGEIENDVVKIQCKALSNGNLITEVYCEGKLAFTYGTER